MKQEIAIVISGAGLITPLGLSREVTWDAVRAGRCGLGPLTAIEQTLPPGSTGGQAPDLPADFEASKPREVRYLRRAIADALADAGIDPLKSYSPHRCGVMIGTTLHGMRAAGQFLRSGNHGSLSDFLAGATLRDATANLPFTGFSATNCSACSSSLGSIALGVSLLRSGQLDLVVAGGYDTISEYVYGGFNSLRLVAPGALRPFTRDRQGMKLAEGYGIVVLERAADAAARGKGGLATILGYGESADAHHLTQPHPQGEGAARAMSEALSRAGISAADIELIAAHATGTPDNDAGEYAALTRVFADDLSRVPVVAFKSHLGHTLGAAGAVELILSALCLRDQIVPACANIRPDEIEFAGLNVSTGSAKPARIRATLNTSLGFGGANTCVVLGRPMQLQGADSASISVTLSPRTLGEDRDDGFGSRRVRLGGCDNTAVSAIDVPSSSQNLSVSAKAAPGYSALSTQHPALPYITGVGVVLPGMIGNDAFAGAMTAAEPRAVTQDTGPIAESEYIGLLNARRVRRMSDYVKLSLAATMLACRDAGIDDIPAFAANCSAILGTTHGSANYSQAYYEQIVKEGILAANPMLFAEGVPNAGAAHLSLMLALKGPCQTIIGTRTAGLDALHLAATRIASGEWDRAVVSAAEEFSPLVNAAYGHWGLHCDSNPSAPFSRSAGGFVAGCGAVTLVLESAASMEKRNAAPRGRILHSIGPIAVPFRRGKNEGKRMKDESARAFTSSFILSPSSFPHPILSSANGTWLDRLESLAIGRRNGRTVSSLAGHLAEIHSVMPLAGIAAVLLTGRLPELMEGKPVGNGYQSPGKRIERFAVTGSDYTGLLSAATIELADRL